MKKKWSLVVAIVVIILLVVAIICTAVMNKSNDTGNELDNQQQVNDSTQGENSESVKMNLNIKSGESANLGDFKVDNLTVQYKDGYTFVQGNIENQTEVDYPMGAALEVTLYKDGVELIKFPVLTSSLNKGERSTFESQLTVDCSDATEVKIDLKED